MIARDLPKIACDLPNEAIGRDLPFRNGNGKKDLSELCVRNDDSRSITRRSTENHNAQT